MAKFTYRQRRSSEIWPGFVDALATLLMVIIFLVMIFVLAQFFLSEALSGRDAALQKLESQVNELADLLALERRSNDDLRLDVTQLAEELQVSVALRDDLNATVETLTIRAEAAETKVDRLNRELEKAFETMMADKVKIETQVAEITTLAGQVAALQALKKNLESEIAGLADKLERTETDLGQSRADLEKNARTMMADKNKIELQVAEIAKLAGQVAALQALKQSLESEIAEIADKLERTETDLGQSRVDLEKNARTMMADKNKIELQVAEIAKLARQVATLQALKQSLESEIAEIADKLERTETDLGQSRVVLEQARADLEKNARTMMADRNKIELQVAEIAKLAGQVAALQALKQSLESEIAGLADKLHESETDLGQSRADLEKTEADRDSSNISLIKERELSESARAQVALLNRQMAALRNQLRKLSAILEASEKLALKQKVQITSLGSRLNAALAAKVQELSRYRSEFFGRLREVLGGHRGIRVVGDRFVFQSEVLFATGSAELGEAGRAQLAQLAATLGELSRSIPPEINWILRIDGHTDRVPIHTAKYPSNWELSTDRAISVVRFLVDEGVPSDRLAASGFGEHQPIDPRDDEIAYRRNRRIELKLDQR